ncbi:MAG: hypothetical protein NTU61_05770 [Candidatus Altiarchaeota archaeon]|nr:hypothetical protein [Candidatus Altiarchaeota archaeon]
MKLGGGTGIIIGIIIALVLFYVLGHVGKVGGASCDSNFFYSGFAKIKPVLAECSLSPEGNLIEGDIRCSYINYLDTFIIPNEVKITNDYNETKVLSLKVGTVEPKGKFSITTTGCIPSEVKSGFIICHLNISIDYTDVNTNTTEVDQGRIILTHPIC